MESKRQRDTFIFYRSFKESMSDLSDADKLIMYEAITDYSLDMKEPELTGFPKAFLTLIHNVGKMVVKVVLPKGIKTTAFQKVQPKYNRKLTRVQPKYKLIRIRM